MKKQIQLFENHSISIIETHVNEYLERLNPSNIIDVKYSHYFDHMINQVWYTAMVLYWSDVKESEEEENEKEKEEKQMPLKYTAVSQPL